MNLRLVRFTIIAMAAAAACSSDNESTTAPAAQLDVSAALSAATAGDPWSYPNFVPAANLPALTSTLPTNCAFTPAAQRFDCAPVAFDGLTIKTSYYLLGAEGGSLSTPDASNVAAIRALIDITGTVALPPASGPNIVNTASIAVNKHDDLTLSGLLSGTRIVNGTTTEHDVLTTTGAVTSSGAVDINSTTANLVLPAASNKYPTGTITVDATGASTIAPLPTVTTTSHSVLTFNGTNIVTLVTTVAGQTQTCQLDLASFFHGCL